MYLRLDICFKNVHEHANGSQLGVNCKLWPFNIIFVKYSIVSIVLKDTAFGQLISHNMVGLRILENL